MRKKIASIFVLLISMCLLANTAFAKTFTGEDDWQVTFTGKAEMSSNFKTSDLDDLILGMQPGDDVIISIKLSSEHKETTDWYMTNEVLSSLEDHSNAASGGAYTYTLSYVGPDGEENVLFDSDTVGGETVGSGGEGLNEATNALKDFFYLDTIKTGESGTITLRVALDGETQGNGYQDTLADLQMNFAVELQTDTTTIVVTGDDSMTPYFIAAGVSGLLILAFAVYSLHSRRKARRAEENRQGEGQ